MYYSAHIPDHLCISLYKEIENHGQFDKAHAVYVKYNSAILIAA